jgi:hypothetical protein
VGAGQRGLKRSLGERQRLAGREPDTAISEPGALELIAHGGAAFLEVAPALEVHGAHHARCDNTRRLDGLARVHGDPEEARPTRARRAEMEDRDVDAAVSERLERAVPDGVAGDPQRATRLARPLDQEPRDGSDDREAERGSMAPSVAVMISVRPPTVIDVCSQAASPRACAKPPARRRRAPAGVVMTWAAPFAARRPPSSRLSPW